jgi:hypothetical protein
MQSQLAAAWLKDEPEKQDATKRLQSILKKTDTSSIEK